MCPSSSSTTISRTLSSCTRDNLTPEVASCGPRTSQRQRATRVRRCQGVRDRRAVRGRATRL
eukprot:6043297-Prymnesium_polylepis.2